VKIVTVSGPPSSGKTSVIIKTIEYLQKDHLDVGVIKFDSLSTYDDVLYQKLGVKVKVGLSGNLCPDHYYMTNIEDCVQWGVSENLDMIISESAGLCNRCSPHIRDVLAICVIDNLSGINTPKKIGPMLRLADIVVITKGDIVSQAEREVFAFRVKQSNPKAAIIFINGITGQGAYDLSVRLKEAHEFDTVEDKKLRFSMPAAVCSYCTGEIRIGEKYQTGNIRKIKLW
jgi:Ni2+-binding GTPase involved in maturation of urease and hydrogenase